MRITSNQIGNYGPGYSREIQQNLPARSSAGTHRTEAAARMQNAELTEAQSSSITSEEKNFFINMYPDNKNEITDYHFYQKNGRMSGVTVGSLFDRRG
ncbi:MAG: hypothetical protein ACM3SM_02735 [Bacteroidota bacterium]